jgi:hypothetical protein
MADKMLLSSNGFANGMRKVCVGAPRGLRVIFDFRAAAWHGTIMKVPSAEMGPAGPRTTVGRHGWCRRLF